MRTLVIELTDHRVGTWLGLEDVEAAWYARRLADLPCVRRVACVEPARAFSIVGRITTAQRARTTTPMIDALFEDDGSEVIE